MFFAHYLTSRSHPLCRRHAPSRHGAARAFDNKAARRLSPQATARVAAGTRPAMWVKPCSITARPVATPDQEERGNRFSDVRATGGVHADTTAKKSLEDSGKHCAIGGNSPGKLAPAPSANP
jgi:hypothetical protein